MLNFEGQINSGLRGVAIRGKNCHHTCIALLFFFSFLIFIAFTSCLHFCLVETETQEAIDKVRCQRAKHDTAQDNRRISWLSSLSLLFSLTFLFAFYIAYPSSCFFLVFFSNFSFFLFLLLLFSLSVSHSTSLLWFAIFLLYIPAVLRVCVCVCVCVSRIILAHVLVHLFV